MRYTNFGESVNYPPNTWSNYVNEIYTLGDIRKQPWTFFRSAMFGQFNVFGGFPYVRWLSRTSGVLYVPNSTYDFGELWGRFDGTFYIQRERNDRITRFNDINLNPNALLGRGLGGGLTQPSSIPWVVLPGTIQEI